MNDHILSAGVLTNDINFFQYQDFRLKCMVYGKVNVLDAMSCLFYMFCLMVMFCDSLFPSSCDPVMWFVVLIAFRCVLFSH